MKYKKFLLIPLLLFIYINFIVDMLVSYGPRMFPILTTPSGDGAGGQPIGVGGTVSVVATRPYFLGLIRLPIYTNQVGYIGNYHKMFFYSMGALTVIFVILEFFVEITWGGISGKEAITERGYGKMKKDLIKTLAKAIGLGVAFGFVVYILSADAGVSVGLGLLLMYLEYKLK